MEESLVAVLGKHILDKSLITGKVCNYDDDGIDRLNHIYTTALIGLCVTFMFTKQLVGKPISCWLPSEFSDSQVQYAEHVCWVMSTYYVKLEENIPIHIFRKTYRLHYYQWIPFILIGQAGLYIIPNLLWSICNKRYRRDIIMTMQNLITLDIDTPDKELQQSLSAARKHFNRILFTSRSSNSQFIQTKHNRYSTGVSSIRPRVHTQIKVRSVLINIAYLCCKSLYVANCICQIIIMSRYLKLHNIFYGFELLRKLLSTSDYWVSDQNFPRITFCDFEIRAIGQPLRYTSQCVLAVNMFNEKIYLFLWLWNILLFVLNFYSFIKWCYRSASNYHKEAFLSSLLRVDIIKQPDYAHRRREFMMVFLRQDGAFLLYLIRSNLGPFISASFIQYLWDRYRFKTPRTPSAFGAGGIGYGTGGCGAAGGAGGLTIQQLARGISTNSYNEVLRIAGEIDCQPSTSSKIRK